MKKLFFPLFILNSFLATAQTDSLQKNQYHQADSALAINKDIADSILIAKDAAEKERVEAANKRNLDYILNLQKERKAKQKKTAIIRIAIGLGFLIILIIGVRRKGKK